MNSLLIVGAGGHGKVVYDLAKNYYSEIVFADDGKVGSEVLGCKVKFSVEDALNNEKCDFIIAIGNNETRKKLFLKFIEKGFTPVTLVHPSAIIGEEVEIGRGTVVFANAVINPQAKIGVGCIINTSALIEHDCEIGEFTHICPATKMAGTVKIGQECFIGIGSVIVNNISVESRITVGAGTVVVKDLIDLGTYVGNPAKKIK